jgi:hypothetical protein
VFVGIDNDTAQVCQFTLVTKASLHWYELAVFVNTCQVVQVLAGANPSPSVSSGVEYNVLGSLTANASYWACVKCITSSYVLLLELIALIVTSPVWLLILNTQVLLISFCDDIFIPFQAV